MIRSSRRLFAAIPAALLAVAMGIPTASSQEVLDGIAAVVNKDVVTFSQVRELVGAKEKAARETLRGEALIEEVKKIRLQAVNDLIDRQLILDEFNKNGYKIPDYVVEERIQTIIREEFGGDRSAFLRTLAAQGYSIERFRKIELDKIIVQAMRSQMVKGNVIVPAGKIQEFYRKNMAEFTTEDQMKLRMIVLKKDGSSSEDGQLRMMKELREKVAGGAPFEDLARMYSEDSTQESGGDWGWIDRKTLNEELTRTAFALKPGEVSRILTLGDNHYLLYCEAKKPGITTPLKDVQADIERRLVQVERQKEMEEWLSKLRKKAYIKVY